MALLIKAGSFTKSTGAAPVSQAVTGVGFNPKVVFFFFSGGTASGTFVNSYHQGFSFTAGASASASMGAASQHNVAASNNSKRLSTSAITVVEWGEVLKAECALTSFDNNGFTLNWTTNDSTAYIIHYLALGGADITNAAIASWTAPVAIGNKAITGVGFQPDCVIHLSHQTTGGVNTSSASSRLNLGAMTTTNQWNTTYTSLDAVNPTDTQRSQLTDSCIANVSSAQLNNIKASYVSMDADGFTTNFTAAAASAVDILSLCLKGGRYSATAWDKVTGGAPATQTVTGVGFRPQGFLLNSFLSVSGAAPAQSRQGFSATDGLATESCAINDGNNITPSSVQGVDTTTKLALKVNNSTSTVDAEASLTSLDADGETLSFTTNDAIATQYLQLSFASNATQPSNTNLLTMGV